MANRPEPAGLPSGFGEQPAPSNLAEDPTLGPGQVNSLQDRASLHVQYIERAYRLGLIGEQELGRVRHYFSLPGHHLAPQEALAELGVTRVGLALIEGDSRALEPYRLTERLTKLDDKPLGEGGMGSIVRAHEGILNRILAVKLIKNPHGNALARFEREAKLMAKLRHPNCVTVVEAGLTRTGDPYYAMDLIQGRSLQELITQSPGGLDPAQTVAWCRDIALALSACHERGIVHRDVKPANIMIDHAGVPLLTDFGIAQHAETSAQLTQRGSLLGTLGYMPPEQLVGEEVDARADVYALGATLFHALSGTRLFDHDDARVVIAKAMGADPPSLRHSCPDLPDVLDRAVQRCLAKRREDRYATARELAQDLDALLEQFPGGQQLQTSGTVRRSEVPSRRGRGRWVAFAAGLGIGLIAGAGGTLRWAEKPAPAPVAPTEAVAAVERLELALQQERAKAKELKAELARRRNQSARHENEPEKTTGLTGLGGGEYRNERDGSILIKIPPTEFVMGGGPEQESQPAHRVRITRAYYIGKFEVSVGQYRRFCVATGRRLPDLEIRPERGETGYRAKESDPVFNVTYLDASDYCKWAGLRLPTEAEWELAARGTDGRLYPWGQRFFNGRARANLGDESSARAGSIGGRPLGGYDDGYPWLAPVDSMPQGASPFGCVHMVGNVQEWVSDRYGRYGRSSSMDPTGASGGAHRVVRASGWAFTGGFTTTKRLPGAESTHSVPELGFRVAGD